MEESYEIVIVDQYADDLAAIRYGKAARRPRTGPSEDQILLRVEEAGRMLALGRTKAYELAKSGKLPVVRIGRALRVPKAPLLALIATMTTGGTD